MFELVLRPAPVTMSQRRFHRFHESGIARNHSNSMLASRLRNPEVVLWQRPTFEAKGRLILPYSRAVAAST